MAAPIPAPVPSLAPIYSEKRPITIPNPDHFFWQPTFDAAGQLIPPSVDLMKPGSASTYFVSPPASSDATWGRLARVEPTPLEVAAVLDAHFSTALNLRFPHSARPALDRDLLDSMSRVQQDYDPKIWQAVLRYWRSKYEHERLVITATHESVLAKVPAAASLISPLPESSPTNAADSVSEPDKKRRKRDSAAESIAEPTLEPRPLTHEERCAIAGIVPATTVHAALQENDELLHHLRFMRAAAKETMADVNMGAVASTQDISTYLRPGNSELSIASRLQSNLVELIKKVPPRTLVSSAELKKLKETWGLQQIAPVPASRPQPRQHTPHQLMQALVQRPGGSAALLVAGQQRV